MAREQASRKRHRIRSKNHSSRGGLWNEANVRLRTKRFYAVSPILNQRQLNQPSSVYQLSKELQLSMDKDDGIP